MNESIRRIKKIISLRKRNTLKSIGLKYNISKQRVSEILKKGIPIKKELICLICRKSFISYTKKSFCSKHSRYFKKQKIEPWRKQGREFSRGIVRARDNYTCQSCGEKRTLQMSKKQNKKQLDVHHLGGLCGKKSKKYDSVKELKLMITLCHKCHYNHPEHSKNIVKNKVEKKLSTI